MLEFNQRQRILRLTTQTLKNKPNAIITTTTSTVESEMSRLVQAMIVPLAKSITKTITKTIIKMIVVATEAILATAAIVVTVVIAVAESNSLNKRLEVLGLNH